MRCSGEFDEFGVDAEAFEAFGHPGGCGAEVGLPVGVSHRVRRVWPMTFEHVAHALFDRHRFPVEASGLVSDGQGVRDSVVGEPISG